MHRLPETRWKHRKLRQQLVNEDAAGENGISHRAKHKLKRFSFALPQFTSKVRSRGFVDIRNMKEKREEWNSARLWWIEWFSFQSSNSEREDENKKTEITNTCLLISNLINNVSTVELIEGTFRVFFISRNLQDKAFRLRSSLNSTHSNVSVNFW